MLGLGQRLGQRTASSQQVGQVRMRIHQPWIDEKRGPKRRQRFVTATESALRHPQVIVKLGHPRIAVACADEQPERLVERSLLQRQDPQHVQGIGVVWLESEHLAVVAVRFDEPPRLMECNALLEMFPNPRICHRM